MLTGDYINIGTNMETFLLLTPPLIGLLGLVYFLRIHWKRYGLLFILASVVGYILCLLFVKFGFYVFPYRLFPKISFMPIIPIILTFPVMVLAAVRFSPTSWKWKIPFYWTIVNTGVFWEAWAQNKTKIIDYKFYWNLWDSYTWWWIYFLLFEWIGGLIITEDLRKPLNNEHLKYGELGWALIHFILIITIFLAGYYLGTLKTK